MYIWISVWVGGLAGWVSVFWIGFCSSTVVMAVVVVGGGGFETACGFLGGDLD